jgi:hypothetical protein
VSRSPAQSYFGDLGKFPELLDGDGCEQLGQDVAAADVDPGVVDLPRRNAHGRSLAQDLGRVEIRVVIADQQRATLAADQIWSRNDHAPSAPTAERGARRRR